MGDENFASVANAVARDSGLEARWVGDDFVTFVDDSVRLVLTELDERSFTYLLFRLGDLDYTNGVRPYSKTSADELVQMLTRSAAR